MEPDEGRRVHDVSQSQPAIEAFRQRLADGPGVLLDGATGTELERRGHDTGLPLWSSHALLDAPDALAGIHADYARAGADILTANTFRTQRRTLGRAGPSRPPLGPRDAELTALAVELARRGARAVERRVWVAGSAPPLEDCYAPERVPGDRALRGEHARHMENLAAAGVDLVLVETMNSVREAAVACRSARACGLPLLVSFIAGEAHRLLSGERLDEAIAAVSAFDPLAVLVNCVPPSAVTGCLPALQGSGLPFGIYANLGEPAPGGGFERSEACSPAEWADHAHRWVSAGARIVGGCCGTTPAHIGAMQVAVRER
jgi:S-methylmethionine-dependent homocysteine/selenocysteine methylase